MAKPGKGGKAGWEAKSGMFRNAMRAARGAPPVNVRGGAVAGGAMGGGGGGYQEYEQEDDRI